MALFREVRDSALAEAPLQGIGTEEFKKRSRAFHGGLLEVEWARQRIMRPAERRLNGACAVLQALEALAEGKGK